MAEFYRKKKKVCYLCTGKTFDYKDVDILKKYMPEVLSDDELNKIIDEVFEIVKPTSIKDLGKVMKEITPRVKNRCDMSKLNSILREKLN